MESVIITRIVFAILISLGFAVAYMALVIGAALLYAWPSRSETSDPSNDTK